MKINQQYCLISPVNIIAYQDNTVYTQLVESLPLIDGTRTLANPNKGKRYLYEYVCDYLTQY